MQTLDEKADILKDKLFHSVHIASDEESQYLCADEEVKSFLEEGIETQVLVCDATQWHCLHLIKEDKYWITIDRSEIIADSLDELRETAKPLFFL